MKSKEVLNAEIRLEYAREELEKIRQAFKEIKWKEPLEFYRASKIYDKDVDAAKDKIKKIKQEIKGLKKNA